MRFIGGRGGGCDPGAVSHGRCLAKVAAWLHGVGMRVIVTGVSGLAGTAIAQEAIQRGHKVLGVYQRNKPTLEGLDGAVQRDLSDLASLQNWLMEAWPDAVINAAAVSAISDVDRDPDAAARVNIDMPALLAQVCHHMGIRFVHMSTDMVFCGE